MRHLILHTGGSALNSLLPERAQESALLLLTSGHSEVRYQGLYFKPCLVASETAWKITGQLDT